MDKVDEINQELIELWKSQFKDDERVRLPLFYPPLNKDAELLFIGLNPSFGKRIKPKKRKWFLWKEFLQRKCQADDIRKVQEMEQRAKSHYGYYAPFRKMARDSDVDWEHVDLFFYRKTSQTKFKAVVSDENSFSHLNDFGNKQLELSKQLISLFRPKVIVVANRAAGIIFGHEFRVTPVEDQPSYRTELNGLTVATFFTPITRWLKKDARQQLEKDILKALA
jgi:hypothetical protein